MFWKYIAEPHDGRVILVKRPNPGATDGGMSPAEARALAAELVKSADAVESPFEYVRGPRNGTIDVSLPERPIDAAKVERSCFTCKWAKGRICMHPPSDIDIDIDQYAIDAGCAKDGGGMPTDRTIDCIGHEPKEA